MHEMVGCEKVTVVICVSLRTKPVTPGSSIWLHIFWTFDSPAGPHGWAVRKFQPNLSFFPTEKS